MADVIETQIMENHQAPVIVFQLACDVSGNVMIYLCEVLTRS